MIVLKYNNQTAQICRK